MAELKKLMKELEVKIGRKFEDLEIVKEEDAESVFTIIDKKLNIETKYYLRRKKK